MSSYAISERISTQTVLWAIGGALYQAGRAVAALVAIVLDLLPWLLLAAVVAVGAFALFAIVSAVPVSVWLCVGVIVAYAYAAYPRSKGQVK